MDNEIHMGFEPMTAVLAGIAYWYNSIQIATASALRCCKNTRLVYLQHANTRLAVKQAFTLSLAGKQYVKKLIHHHFLPSETDHLQWFRLHFLFVRIGYFSNRHRLINHGVKPKMVR